MSTIDRIISRIESGSRVRIVQDYFGQEAIEIPYGWLPISRRIKLSHDDIVRVKSALSRRRRSQKRPLSS